MTAGDVLLTVLAAVGGLTIACSTAVVLWFALAADRTPLADEDATLDVQNHIGDTRPLARWEPLDPVTDAEYAADLRQLADIDPTRLFADCVALSSGRSYRYSEWTG